LEAAARRAKKVPPQQLGGRRCMATDPTPQFTKAGQYFETYKDFSRLLLWSSVGVIGLLVILAACVA
jgi:hypothetical protein